MKFLIIVCLFLTSCASWTKQEKVAAGFFLAAHTANAYSTETMLDNPNNWEKNPILGKYPSDEKVVMYFSITGGLGLLVAHIWKDARQWLLWGYGGANVYWTVHDSKLD